MRIHPRFKCSDFGTFLFDFSFKHLINILVQFVQHVVEAFGDLSQFIFPAIRDSRIEIPVLHLAGKADNAMCPFGETGNEHSRQ
ncbi:hypothetical protein D3C73_1590990 [compost metagenome]